LMGGAGMFATSIFNPLLGSFMDKGRAAALASGMEKGLAELKAGQDALLYMCIFPIVLLVAFTIMSIKMKGLAKEARH